MKILVTIRGDFVAPRFDLTGEVLVASCYDGKLMEEPRSIILSDYSAEKLCDFILKENIGLLICGGIEEQHYRFLSWKKIQVIDSVIGPYEKVLEMAVAEDLTPGAVLPGATSCKMTQ